MPAAALQTENPLVSVIIPSYNHGHYLAKAIESVRKQTYKNTEIVVVDDGSSDNTKVVAEQYPGVKYVFQKNKGLSAARNTGVRHSKGDFLVFLDADDWLYPSGVEYNVRPLLQQTEAAFVSGTFDAVYVDKNLIKEKKQEVKADHYCQLLKGNYIGMIATVLFRRRVFDEFEYDETLKNCEDYDLYLKVARKYPVFHHQNKIAAYRLHTANMSGNIPKMLTGVLKIQARQSKELKTAEEKKAYKTGRIIWKNFYTKEMYQKLLWEEIPVSNDILLSFLKHKPSYLLKYVYNCKGVRLKNILKNKVPNFSLRQLHSLGLHKNYKPAIGKVAEGDFSLTSPFSTDFGYDRGGPLDRYYIENFLDQETENIKGRALEIGDNSYTMKFGGHKVGQSDILHVDDSNKAATFVGDITNAPQIPDNIFDCIILTQTLHLIYDFKEALKTCHRILKPGGTLLLTVPGITPIAHDQWTDIWYWSFTDRALRKVMAETFPASSLEVKTYGNVYAASAFLYGMGLSEIPKAKLDVLDPHYQVIISVKAQKTLRT